MASPGLSEVPAPASNAVRKSIVVPWAPVTHHCPTEHWESDSSAIQPPAIASCQNRRFDSNASGIQPGSAASARSTTARAVTRRSLTPQMRANAIGTASRAATSSR